MELEEENRVKELERLREVRFIFLKIRMMQPDEEEDYEECSEISDYDSDIQEEGLEEDDQEYDEDEEDNEEYDEEESEDEQQD
jgi:hypothetical protein